MAENQTRDSGKMAMGATETILYRLRPHPMAFFRYYSVGVLILIWTGLLAFMINQGWLEFEWSDENVNALMPSLFLLLGMVLIGRFMMGGYGKAFNILFWFAVIVIVVVPALYIWYWKDPDFAVNLALIFGVVVGLLAILTAELYRRAFSYIVTNQRIVLKYKLISVEETTLRYEKIEDFTIERSMTMRVFGLGTIRAWTGSEDAKHDTDRSFNDPHEAMYGIRKPYEVKGRLVELILARDERDQQMIDLLEDKKAGSAPAQVQPQAEPEAAPVTAPEAAESAVAYYQPAPAPEPQPEPAPVRNYERIDPAAFAQPEAVTPPPVSHDEEGTEPQPSPVRKMYPEAEESSSEFQLEGGGDMDFHRPPAGNGAPPSKDGPRKRKYDGSDEDVSKPRSL